MSFSLTEMRIGLTEEFCVGKSELRGEVQVGLSLLSLCSGHYQKFHEEKLEIDPHPTPVLLSQIQVSRRVFLSF